MYGNINNFWPTSKERNVKRSARAELRIRYGCTQSYDEAQEAVLNADHPNLILAGATGAGKSSALNTILYNTLQLYDYDALRVFILDCKDISFDGLRGFSGRVPTVWPGGTGVDDRRSFLESVLSYARGNTIPMLVIIDEVQCLSENPELMKLLLELLELSYIRIGTYCLLCSQSYSGMVEAEKLCPSRLCLRCSPETATRVIGTSAPSMTLERFGQIWYTENIFADTPVRHCMAPYIPEWRLWDKADLQKLKVKDKVPQNHLCLLDELTNLECQTNGITLPITEHVSYFTLCENSPVLLVPERLFETYTSKLNIPIVDLRVVQTYDATRYSVCPISDALTPDVDLPTKGGRVLYIVNADRNAKLTTKYPSVCATGRVKFPTV